MTSYDSLLSRRTAALGAVLGLLLFLTMLGTDDAASTHAGRLGRLAALLSLAGGGAAYLALAQARGRGELRALAATGLSPARAALGPVVGGTAIGLVGIGLALVPGVDLAPLFPRAVPVEGGWVPDGGAWLDPVHGVRIAVDGAVSWASGSAVAPSAASRTLPAFATLIALGVAAVALPSWATARGPLVRRAAVSFAVASAAVFVFHLVAAQRVGAMTLVLPPLLLLVDAVALHRSGGTWS